MSTRMRRATFPVPRITRGPSVYATPEVSREWRLVSRPMGRPKPRDFMLRTVPLPAPGPGQVLVRNLMMSVDPYTCGRAHETRTDSPSRLLGESIDGPAVGIIVVSAAKGLAAGDYVTHYRGWCDYLTLHTDLVTAIDVTMAAPSTYLSVLGDPGLTAYAGLIRMGELKSGDTVFVSGAADAVGGIAGQIAKLKGAGRVVGSADSDEKVNLLTEEYGFDAAFNYQGGPATDQLKQAAPNGIDLYFDNEGGEHLETVMENLVLGGRIVMAETPLQQTATAPSVSVRNLLRLEPERLRIRGLTLNDHTDLRPEFIHEAGAWLQGGNLHYRETIVNGLNNAVDAFFAMMEGANTGKMIIKMDN
ncbi:NADP-dependent oxidoreductase [Streptomyces sp. NPDC101225]|uniref:NADP-dependent oxidoreductase n=1 Tax=Streptomyces sp. NPDC101225 TaxID=3366135 RepID=UPI003830B456